MNNPHGLSFHTLEIIQLFGKQNRAQVSNVPRSGRTDFTQDDRLIIHLQFMEAKIDFGRQKAQQSAFQFLVADFCPGRPESRADDLMGTVIHTPYQVRIDLSQKCG